MPPFGLTSIRVLKDDEHQQNVRNNSDWTYHSLPVRPCRHHWISASGDRPTSGDYANRWTNQNIARLSTELPIILRLPKSANRNIARGFPYKYDVPIGKARVLLLGTWLGSFRETIRRVTESAEWGPVGETSIGTSLGFFRINIYTEKAEWCSDWERRVYMRKETNEADTKTIKKININLRKYLQAYIY